MANFKRKKRKQSVRCTMCTNSRWLGNNVGRFKTKEENLKKEYEKEISALQHYSKDVA